MHYVISSTIIHSDFSGTSIFQKSINLAHTSKKKKNSQLHPLRKKDLPHKIGIFFIRSWKQTKHWPVKYYDRFPPQISPLHPWYVLSLSKKNFDDEPRSPVYSAATAAARLFHTLPSKTWRWCTSRWICTKLYCCIHRDVTLIDAPVLKTRSNLYLGLRFFQQQHRFFFRPFVSDWMSSTHKSELCGTDARQYIYWHGHANMLMRCVEENSGCLAPFFLGTFEWNARAAYNEVYTCAAWVVFIDGWKRCDIQVYTR